MKFNVIIKIYIFLFLIFDTMSSLFADSHVNSCTITNGVFSAAQVIDNAGDEYCASAPESYEVIVY